MMSLRRATATTAVATRAFGTATNSFGVMLPKVDFHKDVANTKYVRKSEFNPYAADFMEALEKKSNAASLPGSCPGNQFVHHAHTGSNIFSDFVGCKM